MTYGYVAAIENLVAMAIVATNKMAQDAAKFEKDFYSKPFNIVGTLTEAVAWTYKELEKYNTQNKG